MGQTETFMGQKHEFMGQIERFIGQNMFMDQNRQVVVNDHDGN